MDLSNFEAFGDSALTVALRCFVGSVDVRVRIISDLNDQPQVQCRRDHFITFPQRDLHLDTSGPLQVELWRGREVFPLGERLSTDDGAAQGAVPVFGSSS